MCKGLVKVFTCLGKLNKYNIILVFSIFYWQRLESWMILSISSLASNAAEVDSLYSV